MYEFIYIKIIRSQYISMQQFNIPNFCKVLCNLTNRILAILVKFSDPADRIWLISWITYERLNNCSRYICKKLGTCNHQPICNVIYHIVTIILIECNTSLQNLYFEFIGYCIPRPRKVLPFGG